jgi:two-component system, chemotaxis family, CheB/CheR fusion protein
VGLTLVRGLVEKHGGTVSARSDGEGKGSEFEVRLPVTERPSEKETTRGSPLERFPRGSRIVVVEDNADSREALCTLLTRAGFECHTTDHGISGLELMDEVRPHIAFVDIGLPGIDGLEFARRLREKPQHKDAYLIALTGYGQQSDREKARMAGFDEHLVKPVDLATLKRLLADGERATVKNGV